MIWRLQTDSSKRLAELDRERSKTATIIESIEDGLIVLDPQRAIVHMNEVASAILDVPQAGILGTRLESLRAQRWLARGAPGGRAGPVATPTTARPSNSRCSCADATTAT